MTKNELKICTKCKIPLFLSEFNKDARLKSGLGSWCRKCQCENRNQHHRNCPWMRALHGIKKRCNNKNTHNYHRYGGRGIKCLLTEEEIKKLWKRDKAHKMKIPSIDREENDGNYVYSNCRFIEKGENSAKDKRKPVYQYSLSGSFIKEWSSATEASRELHIDRHSISDCCRGVQKTSGSFVWKFIDNLIKEII